MRRPLTDRGNAGFFAGTYLEQQAVPAEERAGVLLAFMDDTSLVTAERLAAIDAWLGSLGVRRPSVADVDA